MAAAADHDIFSNTFKQKSINLTSIRFTSFFIFHRACRTPVFSHGIGCRNSRNVLNVGPPQVTWYISFGSVQNYWDILILIINVVFGTFIYNHVLTRIFSHLDSPNLNAHTTIAVLRSLSETRSVIILRWVVNATPTKCHWISKLNKLITMAQGWGRPVSCKWSASSL